MMNWTDCLGSYNWRCCWIEPSPTLPSDLPLRPHSEDSHATNAEVLVMNEQSFEVVKGMRHYPERVEAEWLSEAVEGGMPVELPNQEVLGLEPYKHPTQELLEVRRIRWVVSVDTDLHRDLVENDRRLREGPALSRASCRLHLYYNCCSQS